MPFVFSGIGVEDDDAVIAVAIGDIDFIGSLIDESLRRPPEIFDIVAAFALAGLADLHQEFSILSEFQNHVVVVTQTAGLLSFSRRCRAAGAASTAPRLAPRAPLRTRSAVTADPHITFVVDRDAVIRIRPVVTFSRSRPSGRSDSRPDRIAGPAAPERSIAQWADWWSAWISPASSDPAR